MILEHAVLDVRPGSEAEFEAALERALPHITGATGFGSLRVERCIERTGRYLLLAEWEDVEAHVEGFRRSPAYEQWRAILHPFYEPSPTVEHFEAMVEAYPGDEDSDGALAGP